MKFIFLFLGIIFATVSLNSAPVDFAEEGAYVVAGINDKRFYMNDHLYKVPTTDNIKNKQLNDKLFTDKMTVYYPKMEGQYPVIVLVHGWGVDKAVHAAMARHLATYGFVTAVFSSKHKAKPEDWLPAIGKSFELLLKEADNPKSPLYNKIDKEQLGLVGHSMGGTASLHYANRNPEIDSIIALHPYNGGEGVVSWVGGENEVLGTNLSSLNSDVLILTGSDDQIALPEKTYEFFNGINNKKNTYFFSLNDTKHNHPIEGVHFFVAGTYDEKNFALYRIFITAWMIKTFKKNSSQFKLAEDVYNLDSNIFISDIKPKLKGNEKKGYPDFEKK